MNMNTFVQCSMCSVQLQEGEFHNERGVASPRNTVNFASNSEISGKKSPRPHRPKTLSVSKNSKLEHFFGK